MERRDHVRHLHAGVVDIVLHLHGPAQVAQQAHQSISQNGVSKVADVGCLIGVDVGVLDDYLSPLGRSGLDTAHHLGSVGTAVQSGVHVAGASGLK